MKAEKLLTKIQALEKEAYTALRKIAKDNGGEYLFDDSFEDDSHNNVSGFTEKNVMIDDESYPIEQLNVYEVWKFITEIEAITDKEENREREPDMDTGEAEAEFRARQDGSSR